MPDVTRVFETGRLDVQGTSSLSRTERSQQTEDWPTTGTGARWHHRHSHNEQLGGTALTMYGFFWVTVSSAKLLSAGTTFHFDDMLYIPIDLVYLVFSAVMIYLTAFRSVTLSVLHFIIAVTFLAMVLARPGWISETLPGVGHLGIGVLAFYHAIGSLSFAFTDRALVSLGPPVLFADTAAVALPELRRLAS